jgi:hypothetical protein
MYVCILGATGQVLVHRNVKSNPEGLLETVAPYREDLVVAAECMFTWYWLADVCAAEGIPFVLGHALAMKAIQGGKPRTTSSTPSRSPPCCEAVSCRRRTCIPRPCDRPEISCDVGSTSSGSAGNCSRTSRTRALNISCPSSVGASRI